MLQNMGKTDRIIRLLIAVVAIAVATLYFNGTISIVMAIIVGIIALILLVTSLLGFCPAYFPFKISTRRKV